MAPKPASAPPANTCIIYCRVSTRPQEEEGTSLDTQEAACREYAAKQGWTVVAAIRDVKSGATLERTGLDRARAMLHDGEAVVLLSYAVDRLSRDQDHIGVIYDGLRRAGARLEFVTERFDETPTGRFLLNTFGYVAQLERLNIRDRLLRGKRGRLTKGLLWGGSIDLYGYRRDAKRERRAIYEPEAAVVRTIFRLCIEDRLPTRAIAKHLIEQGVPSPIGGKRRGPANPQWTRGAVYRILTNEAYAGVTVGWRWMGNRDTGRVVQRPQADWVPLPERVSPAIIPPEYWQRAQDQLAANNRNATRNERRRYLLKGILYCGTCGRKMYGGQGGRYACSSYDALTGKCGGVSIRGHLLEAAVWCAVAECLRDQAVIMAAIAQYNTPDARAAALWADEAAGIRRALGDLEQRIVRAVEGYVAGDALAREVFQRQQAQLTTEHRRLTERLAELERQTASASAVASALERVPELCARWRDRLDALDFEGRRLALEGLSVRVTFTPEVIRIEGSVPVEAAVESAVVLPLYARSRHNRTAGVPFVVVADRTGRIVA